MNILSSENKQIEHSLVNNKKNSSVTTQMNELFKGMGYVRNFNLASVFTPPHNNCRETTGLWMMNSPRPNQEEDDSKPYNLASLFLNSWVDFWL